MYVHQLDKESVKLALDDNGKVWLSVGFNEPYFTDSHWSHIRNEEALFFQKHILIAGNKNHLPLCDYLFLHRHVYRMKSVRICRPIYRNEPREIIYCSRIILLPPALGGFRRYREIDSLLFSMQNCDDDRKVRLLYVHPLWPYLSFLTPINPLAVTRVINEIFDPRWFMSQKTEQPFSRVERYFGLAPKPSKSQSERRQMLREVWSVPGSTDDPRSFALRYAQEHGDADRIVLRFIVQSWLALLAGPQRHEFLVPEDLFPYEDTQKAFKNHVYSFKK